jgi:MoxR-like ATPase
MTNFNVGGGHMPNPNGGFEFKPGAALRAWLGNGIIGGRLVVDEIDKAGSDVFAELLAFLDSPESASYMHPDTGEIYRPREGFSAIMTSNIEDPHELPQALKDRFPVCIKIDAAHPAALLKLPENLQQLAAAVVAGQGSARASLRAFDAFETLRKSPNFTPMRAANMVFGKDLAAAIVGALQVGTLTPEVTL